MSAPEMTPAIKRAERALVEAWHGTIGRAFHPPRVKEARATVAAALDVAEIERVIHDSECGCPYDGEHSWDDINRRSHLAARIRVAVLGDDAGEADPGILLILLGTLVAVLLGLGAVAIAAGVLG